jgi:catechol 2,3-dioxygenase-like lactoylglutathione lyase family enzyme
VSHPAPPICGVLETAVYVDDLQRAHAFYGGALGLKRVLDTPRMLTYVVAPAQVLLVFNRHLSRDDLETAEGLIPGHYANGPAHFAFAIAAADYSAWKAHLENASISIRSETNWSSGGRSLYFDDPDGNVVEMATPGLWPNY